MGAWCSTDRAYQNISGSVGSTSVYQKIRVTPHLIMLRPSPASLREAGCGVYFLSPRFLLTQLI